MKATKWWWLCSNNSDSDLAMALFYLNIEIWLLWQGVNVSLFLFSCGLSE
jgi:hypothetical protein